MYTLKCLNVNHALPRAMALLRDEGRRVAPRGMATFELPEPVATEYLNPREMVLFDPIRDANPVFHFFEALWVLRGRSDVRFLAYFLPRMADFSDDGISFHAPYGYRMRTQFGFDQIEAAVNALRTDPDSRQAVLCIWDPMNDWVRTNDKPCNTQVLLKIRDGKLRMTVCNRSNDVVLGAYGANVVQFSTLLVYLAGRIGVGVGTYTQVSDSFHVYEDNPYWLAWLDRHGHGGGTSPVNNAYADGSVSESVYRPDYMMPDELDAGVFDDDLTTFFELWDNYHDDAGEYSSEGKIWHVDSYQTESFRETVLPMYVAFYNWRIGNREAALDVARTVKARDWSVALQAWMQRRLDKAAT